MATWNVITLAQLVDEMRAAQRAYFQERTRSALREAKRLEQRVDAAVLQVLCEVPEQKELFQVES
jgi:hypothetical protein